MITETIIPGPGTGRMAPRRAGSLSAFSKTKQFFLLLLLAGFWFSAASASTPAGVTMTVDNGVLNNAFYNHFYTLTFSSAQTGLTAANFSLTGNVPASITSVTGSGTSWTVNVAIDNSFQSQGTLTLNMVNNTNLSPGVSGLPVAGPTIQAILYPVTGTFSLTSENANSGYAKVGDKLDWSLNGNHYIPENWGVSAGGSLFASGSGNVNQGIVSGTFTSTSGLSQGAISYNWNYTNVYNESTSGSGTSGIIFDSVNPTVSISTPSVSSTANGPVFYTVTYADANFNASTLSTSNITLNPTGTATGTVVSVQKNTNTNYTVVISGISGSGSLAISIGAGTASDMAGNLAPASAASTTFSVVPPPATNTTINSSNNPSFSAFPNNSVIFTATVTSFSGTVNTGTVTFTSNGNMLGSGPVAVSNGTAVLNTSFASTGAYTILATYNENSNFGSSSSPALTQQVIGHTATTLSSDNNPSFSTDPGSLVNFTATVTSAGSPVTGGTVSFTSNGTSLGGSASVVGGTAVLTTIFPTAGTYNIQATYSGTSNFGPSSSSLSQQVNSHPIAINSITANSAYAKSGTIQFTAAFATSVTGLGASNFSLTTSGVSGASVASVSPSSGSTYTVTVNTGTGDGTIGLNLDNATGLTPGISTTLPFAGGTTTIDNTAPAVQSITATSPGNANPTNASEVTYTVTFSEPVTGVSTGAFTATTSGVSTTGILVSPVSSSVYTVTISGISGDGSLRLDLNSSGTSIADVAGNAISGGFTSGDVYNIDQTPPSLTTLLYTSSNANSAYAKAGDVVTLVFGTNETLQTPSVTIAGQAITATNTGGNNYSASYTLSAGDTEGSIPFKLVVTDIAGNSGIYTDVAAGQEITFDMTPPTVTISAPSLNSVSGNGTSPVSYTITYADANFNTSSLDGSGITLNTTGTATGTVGVSGSGTSYTITISNITGAGTLGITVAGGNASDLADNTDAGAGPSAIFTVLSANAGLASINPQYRPMSPQFRPHVFDYTLNVTNAVKTIWIAPVTADPNATMTINGTVVASGSQSAPVTLNEGATSTIIILVTAQDNTTTQTYTVHVKRALSSNALLSSMGPAPGPLSPIFQPGINTYTLHVPNGKTSMTVTPVTADPNATIKVNGRAVTSGSTSVPVSLPTGQTTNINVVITAQDGTTNTYTIAVTRAPSSDADLTAIGPKYGPLSPIFQPGLISYSINLPNDKSTFTVTPVTHDANATITVNGTALASGNTSAAIALTAGSNTNITVVVTAQDGTTTKSYTIAVTRAPGSSDSYQDISVNKPTETVTLAEDGIKVHQGISPNGDGIDDVLQIDNISQYPDNHLKIMNRNGQLVFEAKGYDNTSKVFDGRSNKNGQPQLPGTYFFQLDYTVDGATKTKTGFIVLKY